MEYTYALGTCEHCGSEKLQVEGEVKCIVCQSKDAPTSGLMVTKEDPGEEELNKLLAKCKVHVPPGGKPPIPPTAPPIKPVAQESPDSGIAQAIAILKAVPMPKDIKQFKAINKAIKTLENLGA
jgi:hypothetical protein